MPRSDEKRRAVIIRYAHIVCQEGAELVVEHFKASGIVYDDDADTKTITEIEEFLFSKFEFDKEEEEDA